jgi:hypothetical protein
MGAVWILKTPDGVQPHVRALHRHHIAPHSTLMALRLMLAYERSLMFIH